MSQFDIYRLADGGFVVDCQNELLADIGTRFVVPLMPPAEAPPRNAHLNPPMAVNREELLLMPQFATAIRTSELQHYVGTVAPQRDLIVCALDTLIGAA